MLGPAPMDRDQSGMLGPVPMDRDPSGIHGLAQMLEPDGTMTDAASAAPRPRPTPLTRRLCTIAVNHDPAQSHPPATAQQTLLAVRLFKARRLIRETLPVRQRRGARDFHEMPQQRSCSSHFSGLLPRHNYIFSRAMRQISPSCPMPKIWPRSLPASARLRRAEWAAGLRKRAIGAR